MKIRNVLWVLSMALALPVASMAQRPLYVEIPAHQLPVLTPHQAVQLKVLQTRANATSAYLVKFDESALLSDQAFVQVRNGERASIKKARIDPSQGGYAWFGQTELGSEATFLKFKGGLRGIVQLGKTTIEVIPLSPSAVAVVEMDASIFLPD